MSAPESKAEDCLIPTMAQERVLVKQEIAPLTRSKKKLSTGNFTFWVREGVSSSSVASTVDIICSDDSPPFSEPSRLRIEQSISADTFARYSSESNRPSTQNHTESSRPRHHQAPRANVVAKMREGVRLSSHKLRFQHYYIDPLCFWQGKNDRILLGQTFSTVRVQDGYGAQQVLVNAGSHNYAGFYQTTIESEGLQRLCLEKLAFAGTKAVPSLVKAFNKAVCRHFRTDFCYITSSEFGSNTLAMPAILDRSWLVLIDEKSHSSMHTAVFLAETGTVKRFRHNDMAQLESMLNELGPQHKEILVAVEGFYSMDGTVAALPHLHLLKKKYGFVLYCDEAHSFLSVGSGGRGCLQLWNEENPDDALPDDLIDIRTAALSKVVGGLGGLVFGAARFDDAVQRRFKHLCEQSHESVSTSTIVQALYALGQPQRLRRQLYHLRDITLFCKEELQRLGVHVYGKTTTPILPVHAGKPSMSCKFSYKLRQFGLLATPINVPAVKFWENRVRVALSADLSDAQVNKLLDCIVEASFRVGITKKTKLQRRKYMSDDGGLEIGNQGEEHEICVGNIHALIQRDTALQESFTSVSKKAWERYCRAAVIREGHRSRVRYGLGFGGSRWVTGTFSPHLEFESLLAEATKQEAAMTFSNSELGLSSTMAALCRPLLGYKTHYLLVPSNTPEMVLEGLRFASKREMPEVLRYEDMDDLYTAINERSNSKTYFTVYLDVVVDNGLIDVRDTIEELRRHKGTSGMTLLLDNTNGLGHHGPRRLGIAGVINLTRAAMYLDAQILVYGSFYRAFGLSGGYLVGAEVLISELRYTSRAYMFSTSPLPFVMDMVRKTLTMRLEDALE